MGTERYKRKPWISNRTLDIADEKRKAKAMRTNSDSDKRKYNILVRKTKSSAKEDEEEWIEEQCKEIQDSFDVARTRKAFGLIKKLKQYCSELYTDAKLHDANVLEELMNITPPPQEAGDDEDILREVVDWAIKKLKNNKNTSTDGIPVELIKVGAVSSTVCESLERGDNSKGMDKVTPNSYPLERLSKRVQQLQNHLLRKSFKQDIIQHHTSKVETGNRTISL